MYGDLNALHAQGISGWFLAGTLMIGALCFWVPFQQLAAARRVRECVLRGSAEYLLAADTRDMKALRAELRRVISILLGEATEDECELGIDSACYVWDPVQRVMLITGSMDASWETPDASLPPDRRLAMVGEHLARSRDLRLIRPLADALYFGRRERIVDRSALARLVQELETGDGRVLHSSSMYHYLGDAGRWDRDSEPLILAVLHAVSRCGFLHAIPHVTRLLHSDSPLPPAVIAAAGRCLSELREREERERLGATLLRPSDYRPDDAETLLRPASGAQEAADDRLLRPARLQ